MKKMLLLMGALLVISTTSLSFGGYSYGRGRGCTGSSSFGRMNSGWHHMEERGSSYNELSAEEQQEYLLVREKNLETYNKYGTEISKKQLEVERELLEEKPSWKKIGNLNEDIAKLEAEMKTEQLKNSYN